VRALGYEIVDRFDQGRERGFEIAGVSSETLEKFSQRSGQRDLAIDAFVNEKGRHNMVFPQVAFGAFLTDDGRLSQNARWSISQ
jgi:hypothetical protein